MVLTLVIAEIMSEQEARVLIDKYLNGECTAEERALLEKYLDSYQRETTSGGELQKYEEVSQPKMWSAIQSEIANLEKTKVRWLTSGVIYKMAAVIAGVALSVSLYYININQKQPEQLVIADDKIMLRLGSMTIDEIEVGEFTEISDEKGEKIASQQGDLIVYKPSSSIKELVYNEIEVPRGKKIKLQLSDGTTVHLNSNSVLRFPVNFLEQGERKVFLTGEGYFEVAKDENRPFYVNTEEMSVRVVGTHFNITSYSGSLTSAVLLEGSVAVQKLDGETLSGAEQLIVPGQKATLVTNGIEVRKVDVNDYVGWMQDILIFDDEPFTEIIKKIERKYNVEINNQFESLSSVRFHGKFKEETVIDLLETFKESAGFHYRISNNKIVITPK